MQTKLMVYNARMHQDPRDDQLMGEIGGPGALVMCVDADGVRHVWQACGPASIILIRDWGSTDSPDRMKEIQADPEKAARQHVDYFVSIWGRYDYIPAGHKYAVLANELPCNHKAPAEIDLFARYWHTAITYAADRGLPIVALNISVGWPDNDDTADVHDTPPAWRHPKFAQLIADMRAANEGKTNPLVLVGLHEYFHPADGPEKGWGWYIGRCLWLIREAPDLKIVIAEWGADGYVNPLTPGAKKTASITGFQLNGVNFAQMVQWMIWCDGQYRLYPQILGFCWYLADHQSIDQWSWDWRPFVIDNPSNNPVSNYARSVRDGQVPLPAAKPLPGANGGPVMTLPTVNTPVAGTVPDLALMLKAEFGSKFEDLRAILPHSTRPDWQFDARTPAQIVEIVVHHTTGNSATVTWPAIANDHVAVQGWAGIGYHIGIGPDGKVSYLGDVLTARAHTLNHNITGTGVVLKGDFEKETPTPAAIDALKRVIKVHDTWLGRQATLKGHRDLNATACPGANLYPLVKSLRDSAAVVTPDISALLTAIRLAAWGQLNIPLNTDAALYKFAKAKQLGRPITREFEAEGMVCQGYEQAIAYCAKGDWGNIKIVDWA